MKAPSTPNAQAFYRFKTQDTVIEKIQSALEYGEALITVTGPDGVGKSQVARIIKRIFSDDNFHIVSFNNEVTTELQLYEHITKVVGAVKEENYVSGLQKLLSAESNQNKQLLILADDADRLAPAILNALRILSNLQAESNRLIQLVLFGNNQLNQVLGQPDYFGFLQRVTHTFYLQPLTDTHIQDSLTNNGFNFSFDSAAAKYLASVTQGLPSIIVLFFDALLNFNQKGAIYSKQDIKNIAATDLRIIEARKRLVSNLGQKIAMGAGVIAMVGILWFLTMPKEAHQSSDPFTDKALDQSVIDLANSAHKTEKEPQAIFADASKDNSMSKDSPSIKSTEDAVSKDIGHSNIADGYDDAVGEHRVSKHSNQTVASVDTAFQDESVDTQNVSSLDGAELQQQLAAKEQIEQEIAQLEQERKTLVEIKERETQAYKTSEAVARIAQSYQQQLSNPKSAIESSDLAIRIATDHWANAWSNQSVPDYINSYVADYTMHDGWPRQTWVRLRKQRIEAPDWIKIRVSDFKVISAGSEFYQANFWLHYQSPGYSDHTLKLLTFKMEDSGWKISSEKNLKVVRD